ncbi:MAG: amidohydrolase family protein [Chloroflexota bacterium]
MIDDIYVIDFHGHVGHWDRFFMRDDTDGMLRAMDAVGIDVACLFNIFHPDGTTGNDQTARFIAQHPDRFVGFAYVSPLMPERMVAELTRAIDELHFVAIKLYPPYTRWDLHEPIWHPIYTFANERGLTIIFHTGPDAHSAPHLLTHIAPHYPNANFVAGHAGNIQPYRDQAIAASQAHPNIYLETCSTYRSPSVIEQLVNEAGPEKVLYGSDMPLMDPRAQIGKIITADISDEAKRLVLGGNAQRLLNC